MLTMRRMSVSPANVRAANISISASMLEKLRPKKKLKQRNVVRITVIPVSSAQNMFFVHPREHKVPGAPGFGQRLMQHAEHKWAGYGARPETSLFKKLHNLGTRLYDSLPVRELFLQRIPLRAKAADIDVPAGCLNINHLREDLMTAAVDHPHRKGLWMNVLIMPFVALLEFVPVPLPNLPGLWIGFRIYCHRNALNGAKHLLELLNTRRAIRIHPDEAFGAIMKEEFVRTPYLTDDGIAKVVAHFNAPGMLEQLRRARFQAQKQDVKLGVIPALKKSEDFPHPGTKESQATERVSAFSGDIVDSMTYEVSVSKEQERQG